MPSFASSETSYDLSPDLKLSIENHLRLSGSTLGNNLDLNNDISDGVTYMGGTYNTQINIPTSAYL
ncbi:MAG: hypothetical protein A3G70_05245 [Planctomycetes bacterium RIFCSPLOWO2_12_FULL_39_13]|nr:MAG: hypothetical protein A3G70_05245 [Planctomycetes bacterium RIFCSPLOWO2_12_FULL_39_13]